LAGVVDGFGLRKRPARSGGDEAVEVGHRRAGVAECMPGTVTWRSGVTHHLPAVVDAGGVTVVSAQRAQVGDGVLRGSPCRCPDTMN